MRLWKFVPLFLLIVILVFGCKERKEDVAPPTPSISPAAPSEEELMQQWRGLLRPSLEEIDMAKALQIAHQMVQQGPESVLRFFDIIASKEEEPMAKLLAVISLTPYTNEEHLERLLALTAPDHDNATRGCAAHLLGLLVNPEAQGRLRELFDDADPHVSKVATLVLLRMDDEAAAAKALEMWSNPETGDDVRSEIVLAFPGMRAGAHLSLFVEAVCRSELKEPVRIHAVNTIGMLADSEVISEIDACLDGEGESELKALWEGAKAAIEARSRE